MSVNTIALDRNIIINQTHCMFDRAISPLTSQIYSAKTERQRAKSAEAFVDELFGVSAHQDALDAFEDQLNELEEKYEKDDSAFDKEWQAFRDKQAKELEAFEKDFDKRRQALNDAHDKATARIESSEAALEQSRIVEHTGRSMQAVRKAWKNYSKKAQLQGELSGLINDARVDFLREAREAHPANVQISALIDARTDALAALAVADTAEELKETFNAWRGKLSQVKAPKAKASVKKAKKPSVKKAKASKAKAKKAKPARKSSRKGKK